MNIHGLIKGLHHITATVGRADQDFHFYTRILGMRLIKETVNFDNEQVYHFYYANETGTPSTVFTTFPYHGHGVRQGVIGTGQATETVLSVPGGSLDFWEKRLASFRVETTRKTRFGRAMLFFRDPSGLGISLLEDEYDTREPVWTTEETEKDVAVRGVHHPVIAVTEEDLDETMRFLKEFGYSQSASDDDFTMMQAGEGGAGNVLSIRAGNSLPKGVNGIGTVHHVAHRVRSIDDSLLIKKTLEDEFGLHVTDIRDRKYFKSIYFRIPGGILFEVATEAPGFLIDEPRDCLGSSLKLPEWQEPRREKIEKELSPYR